MNNIKNKIKLNFVKVKGHSNNDLNDKVDEMAKLGTIL
jgi:ribonuclease HI